MKPSNRRKLAVVKARRARHTVLRRHYRYGCSCGHHNMSEKSRWEKFLAAPEGSEWLVIQHYMEGIFSGEEDEDGL